MLFEMDDLDKLLYIAKEIYVQRIDPKQNNIILDKICTEEGEHQSCNNMFCVYNYTTDEDSLLIETGFNIFIFFYNLEELHRGTLTNSSKLEIFHFEE